MMKNLFQLVVCFALAAWSAACFGFDRKSTATGPSASGISALMGNWSSSSIIPTPTSCTDFKWNVTEQTAGSVKGSFSATCVNDLKVIGTAQAAIHPSGSPINWNAEGTATAPGLPSCKITLTGTAELGVSTVRVPY